MNFELPDKALSDDVLRFNPIQIAEWLQDLIDSGIAQSYAGLEGLLGVDRTRIGQFVRLMKFSGATRLKLRNMEALDEYQTRRLLGKRAVMAVGADQRRKWANGER